MGYFSYDYLKYAEPSLRLDAVDTENFQDVDLMLFDKVIAFDHLRQKLIIIVTVDLAQGEASYHKAERDIREITDLLKNGKEK